MTEPPWIRASVVAAGLAGVSDAEILPALDPSDRSAWERVRARIRASGGRAAVARALVKERFALLEPAAATARPGPGAAFYARWLRALGAKERAAVARALDASTAAHVASAARRVRAFEPPQADLATWLVSCARRTLSRFPTATELAEVLAAWRGEGAARSRAAVRVERAVRVAGRRDAYVAFTRETERTA